MAARLVFFLFFPVFRFPRAGFLMLMNQDRRDKELDADEEKEEGSDVIADILGEIEPTSSQQQGER
jgi:hypothetical protein